jgi:hypothetical protein
MEKRQPSGLSSAVDSALCKGNRRGMEELGGFNSRVVYTASEDPVFRGGGAERRAFGLRFSARSAAAVLATAIAIEFDPVAAR